MKLYRYASKQTGDDILFSEQTPRFGLRDLLPHGRRLTNGSVQQERSHLHDEDGQAANGTQQCSADLTPCLSSCGSGKKPGITWAKSGLKLG